MGISTTDTLIADSGSDSDRRNRADRRQEELGPPNGWKERRRRTERRFPEIEEHTISEDEWLQYFGTAKLAVSDNGAVELSSSVLDRIRD